MGGSQSNGVPLPVLILTGGPLDGTEFPLRMGSREVSIGSSGGSDVQISLGNVDPLHAMLTFSPSGLAIADVGSATGTFLNGEKVEEEVTLQDGDRICLGPPGAKESAKLLVRLPGGTVAAPPAAPPDAGPSFIDVDVEAGPVLIGGDDAGPEVSLSEEAPWPPPASPPPASPPPEPPPPPPRPPAPPPAEAPAAPAPPPPPMVAEALTAPPPEEEPPPPDIPRLEEPRPAPPPRRGKSTATGARGGRTGTRRARRSSPPVLPIVGGLLVLLALGAGGWWFFLRPAPPSAGAPTTASQPPPPAAGAQPAPAGAAAAATPQGTHLEPDVALPGQSIQIRGTLPAGPVSVTVAGEAAQVEEATAEVIRLVVPNISLPAGQTVQVVVQAGAKSLPPLDLVLGRLPLILKIEPPAGTIGDRVVIMGRGFDPQPRGNTVSFGDVVAVVLSASPTELAVAVPAPRTVGLPEVPVVVAANGRKSARDRNFALRRPSSSSFVPRFYPAPASRYPSEDYAFVSTEIGPVLLLGGPGGRPSTAVRAAEISARLNELITRAPTRRVDIELRDRPAPAVAVVGEAGTLVSAKEEDVSAYARGWEPGARSGPRLSTATLTRHWAAILEDYFALFLYRERPLEVASLSPRGQVFIDIYSEATRRASGTGVSAGIVLPTPEAMAEALRLAALVPSGGSPREEIAVKGRWQGTIEDPDTGSRRFEVRFTAEGKGLDGAIKTWRGSIELGSPVRDISFRQGTLRFVADLQGTPHHFEGTLHNTTITGKATREGRSPATFTLEFAE